VLRQLTERAYILVRPKSDRLRIILLLGQSLALPQFQTAESRVDCSNQNLADNALDAQHPQKV